MPMPWPAPWPVLLLLATLPLMLSLPPSVDDCPTQSSCLDRYLVVPCPTNCSWAEARSACASRGGVLAKADTNTEVSALRAVQNDAGVPLAWIGAR